jgi:drug/metabolite transporter (DMT)-like permease
MGKGEVVGDRPSSADNLRGIFAMLASQALFLMSDSIVKLAGETLAPSQIMAVRGLMAIYLVGAILVATVSWRKWYMVLRPLVVIRGIIEGAVAVFFLLSLPHLQLGQITVISQVTPLILTVLSAVLLNEAVGRGRWAAVAVGFAGVVLVAQPTAEGVSIHVVGALIMALLVVARDLVTRFIDPGVPTGVVTFTSTVAVCLMGFAGLETQPWAPLTPASGTLLAASAILVTLGIVFVVIAFRDVEVSVVSPFRYSAVVWATLFGYLLWNEQPNGLALIGTALIVLAGLYAMQQEALALRRRS